MIKAKTIVLYAERFVELAKAASESTEKRVSKVYGHEKREN
jgi:hypothetical protein